jgi:hypothetical protein
MSDPGGCPTLADVSTAQRVAFDSAAATGTQESVDRSHVLQLWLHRNRRAGRSSVGLQVHRCGGATLGMTASTCMPHPLQVVFPQRPQRAGLHMWCSSGWL